MNYDKVPELPEPPANTGRRSRVRWLVGICLLLAAAGAGWWHFQSRPATPTLAEIRHQAEIVALEQTLESSRVKVAGLPGDAPFAVRRTLIEDSIARQNDLMRLRSEPLAADTARLLGWQTQLEELAAREAARQSQLAEAAATELMRANQPAAAIEKLREALRLQREVNASISAGPTKSYGREARLQQELAALTGESGRK